MGWQRTAPNPAKPQTGTNSWTRYARDDLFRLFADPNGGRDRERMVDSINRLPDRHRKVLVLMLGMDGQGVKADSQIGPLMPIIGNGRSPHLGRERVRALTIEAIKMLREAGAL